MRIPTGQEIAKLNSQKIEDPKEPIQIFDRLVIHEKVYFSQYGKQPASITKHWEQTLEHSEQAFVRNTKAFEWKESLDLGWFDKDNVGTIHIENYSGVYLQTIPTDEEIEETKKQILEVGFKDSDFCFLVHPKETLRFRPSNAEAVEIRSQHGEINYSYHIFSK